MRPHEKHPGGYLTDGRTLPNKKGLSCRARNPGSAARLASERCEAGLHIAATQVERGELAWSPLLLPTVTDEQSLIEERSRHPRPLDGVQRRVSCSAIRLEAVGFSGSQLTVTETTQHCREGQLAPGPAEAASTTRLIWGLIGTMCQTPSRTLRAQEETAFYTCVVSANRFPFSTTPKTQTTIC